MKIFIGSHGVGKSSLLQYISDRNPDIYVSDGFSRSLKRLKHSERDTQLILNELTLWRWREDIIKKNCIFSRSIIDSIIYMTYGQAFPFTYEKEIERLTIEFETTYKLVDKFFYIPIEFKLLGDEARPGDIDFQKMIDEKLQQFIQKYKLPVVVLTGSLEQRYEIISKYL